jgi:putative chitinase
MAKKPLAKPVAKPVQAKPLPAKATPLLKAAKASGIKGVELAQFLAQMEHESLDFRKMKEIGKANYFNKYDPKHNPKLADKLGNKYKGDGVTFKGRGFIQLTGRENYTKASYDIFGDNRLVKKPDLAAQPDIAARIAVWYWTDRVKPLVKDFTDTTRVTKIINGGLNGLQDREQNFREYMASLSLR